MKRFFAFVGACALLCNAAHADLSQTLSGTFSPTGTNWPTFTCNINCNGPTTTLSGDVQFPQFSGDGTLTGVLVQFASTTGGSYAGTMSVPNPGFTGVTASVGVSVLVTPAASPALPPGPNSLINTVNANNQPFISIPLPTQMTGAGPIALPASALATYKGSGIVKVHVSASFKQDVFPSNFSITGKFALGHTTTILLTYIYAPTNLGGGCSGGTGLPAFTVSGSMQPAQSISFLLTNAAPAAPAILTVSSGLGNPASVPCGGLFFALPNPVVLGVVTDASGNFAATSPVPAGLPIGTPVVVQFAITDPGSAGGYSLSNALRLTTIP